MNNEADREAAITMGKIPEKSFKEYAYDGDIEAVGGYDG
jgi:hypothetical protein